MLSEMGVPVMHPMGVPVMHPGYAVLEPEEGEVLKANIVKVAETYD
jgi:hypothetical protein